MNFGLIGPSGTPILIRLFDLTSSLPIDLFISESEAVESLHKEYTKQRRQIRRKVEANVANFFNDDEVQTFFCPSFCSFLLQFLFTAFPFMSNELFVALSSS